MAKKERISTAFDYLLKMKEYLGQEKMEQYIDQRLPNRTQETRRGIVNRVNAIHAAKYGKPIPKPTIDAPVHHKEHQLEIPLVQ